MSETALIVSATAPVPVDNGKRVVLHGLLDYFVDRLGPDNVHYALLGKAGSQRPLFPGVAHRLDKPGSASQLVTVARRFTTDRSYTLQEAMLGSRALSEQIRALVAWLRPTVEVYDTLRLGQHAPAEPRAPRRVLYLDDLFSVRYERMLAVAAQGDFVMDPLGQFVDFVPVRLRSIVRCPAVYRPILRLERDRIRRREAEVVRSFDASLLVNAEEVELLRERSGVPTIRSITPLLRPVATPVRRPVSPPELVFLGRLNIPHNDDAVCAFVRTAMGELERRCPDVRLRIIGKGASDALLALAAEHPRSVNLEGFVDDLDAVFSRATAVLAPLRFGSGVKIKVLEALARGVPVLATTTAAEGIPVAADGGDGCLIEDDLARWPALLAGLADGGSAAKLSAGALAFFARTYARAVVTAQYDAIFGLSAKQVDSPVPLTAG